MFEKIASTISALPRGFKMLILVLVFVAAWNAEQFLKEAPAKYAIVANLVVQSALVFATVLLSDYIARASSERRLSDLIKSVVSGQHKELHGNISKDLIPGKIEYGLKAVRSNLNFGTLLESLQEGDRVDIFFTYHTELESAFETHIDLLAEKRITVRMLLAYDKSPETIRRFREITRNRDDPNWAGPQSQGASAVARLGIFLRSGVANLNGRSRDFKIELRVYDHLPDHPIVVVKNNKSQTPYNVRFTWLGVYLERAAIRMPVVEWEPVPNKDEICIAIQCATYFERRWKLAIPVDEMDQAYRLGKPLANYAELLGTR